MGQELTAYTGSIQGVCSQFTPVTWHVDRKCHLISASSFDKMCADMMQQADDMYEDIKPHGSKKLGNEKNWSNNHKYYKYANFELKRDQEMIGGMIFLDTQ